MSKKLNSLNEFLVLEIRDLYDAEKRLTKALPKMAESASSAQLKEAIEGHLKETENQVKRLEKVFKLLGEKAIAKTCEAMKGLVSEGKEGLEIEAPDFIKDSLIIASAQKVEHYEIASYGTCKAVAEQLGMNEVASLLDESLEEEKNADRKLTKIAETEIYANETGDEEEVDNLEMDEKSA